MKPTMKNPNWVVVSDQAKRSHPWQMLKRRAIREDLMENQEEIIDNDFDILLSLGERPTF